MAKQHTARIWRVGLVGAGYVSQYHLRALKKLSNVEIVGVTDLDQERAARAASAFGVPSVFRTLQDMSKAGHPDVIHVLTPPSSHCGLAQEALDLGCHVFVEKPMALSEEECERMIAKADNAARVLSVNHSARFDPPVLKALEAVCPNTIATAATLFEIWECTRCMSSKPSWARSGMRKVRSNLRDGTSI